MSKLRINVVRAFQGKRLLFGVTLFEVLTNLFFSELGLTRVCLSLSIFEYSELNGRC